MTKQQAIQLKRGDEIFIRARFKTILGDGDVLFSTSVTNVHDEVVQEDYYTHTENIVLPSELKKPAPKYDPCRPFKKGDEVKLREEVQGRKTSSFVTGLSLGKIYTVAHDEYNHTVAIIGDEGLGRYSFVHLELVTPVEELEPYYVKDDGTHYVVGKRPEEPENVYLTEYSKDRHPHAREAAEAERDRLNAEYGKEQDNG